ncbi:MAG: hypothetical protein VX963_08310 [Actinomycetota bacterium]|jgi:general stress protein 26|nr:hypothetical protein [Actinomycetota bacterium]MEC9058581.1 hypothetical protein [Actinomycetota bacterium]MED5361324.1 hypothetical protein [Actinomycetota bacterium]MEE3256784.1 hypothetical protein [Actinomycetota bacterium]
MPDDYEDLRDCALTEELETELVRNQRECVFMWTNVGGEAFGVVMSYLPKDGVFWLTAAEHRARISAIRRFPRASICISSTGTRVGPNKTISYKGSCTVLNDQTTKDWFYPEFAEFLMGKGPQAQAFMKYLDSPGRVVVKFEPDYSLSFDGDLLWQRSPEVIQPQ